MRPANCPRYDRKSIMQFVEQVVQKLSCSRKPEDIIKKIEGLILQEGENDKILLDQDKLVFFLKNESQTSTRRRLATMLGHLFMHMERTFEKEETYICCPMARGLKWQNENYNATVFAMQLLMPQHDFEKAVGNNTKKAFVDMNAVAEQFGVDLRFAITWGKSLELVRWF